jgi:hypothetical protein
MNPCGGTTAHINQWLYVYCKNEELNMLESIRCKGGRRHRWMVFLTSCSKPHFYWHLSRQHVDTYHLTASCSNTSSFVLLLTGPRVNSNWTFRKFNSILNLVILILLSSGTALAAATLPGPDGTSGKRIKGCPLPSDLIRSRSAGGAHPLCSMFMIQRPIYATLHESQ